MIANLTRHKVTVQRPDPPVKGTSGVQKPTYSVVYSDLPCLVQPVQTNWLIQYQRRSIDLTHTVFFGTDPTIENGDEILFGERTLQVKGIRDLQEWGRVLACDCLEIQ